MVTWGQHIVDAVFIFDGAASLLFVVCAPFHLFFLYSHTLLESSVPLSVLVTTQLVLAAYTVTREVISR